MIAQETIQQLQHASLADRIQMIEILLQSLKHEISQGEMHQQSHQCFAVRAFNLGSDVRMEREAMYAERGE